MKVEEYRRAAVSGARWTIASRVALQLFTWPVTILVMRLLDPSDYGLFALALVVSGFVALFAELGLGVALVQADEARPELQRAASSLILVLNSFVAALLLLGAPLVARAFDEPDLTPIVQLLTLDLLLTAIGAVPQAMLERGLRFRELSLAQMSAGIVGSATTLTVALLDYGVQSLVAGLLAQGVVRAALLIRFHGSLVWPGRVNAALVRPMIHVSGHVIASRSLWYWHGQSDLVVLGRMLSSSVLGLYNVGAQLAMLPAGKAMEAINRVAFPILSRLRSESAALTVVHRRLVALLALYGFGICWGLAAVAPEFVHVVLGEKWLVAAWPLACLSFIAPLRMLCSLHNTITTALGAPEAATKELVLASLAIPAAVAYGAWAYGLPGASLAWPVVYPLVYLVSNRLTCRVIGVGMWMGVRPLVAPIGAGMAMQASVWLVGAALGTQTSPALLLAVEVPVGGATYLGVLWLTARPLLREALDLVRQLFDRPRPAGDGAPA